MLSFESLRKETCIARIPAANGVFLGNFSLYRVASVHGRAVMVNPSWVSREEVSRECGALDCAAAPA
jgi:hypothetical protein